MTVMSVLHLAEGLMASSAGGMTKLLLNGSHIPSPKVYVNLCRAKTGDRANEHLEFFKTNETKNNLREMQKLAGELKIHSVLCLTKSVASLQVTSLKQS